MAWLFIEGASLTSKWQRVCSSANAADAVSRFHFSVAENQGCKRLDADWGQIFREILELRAYAEVHGSLAASREFDVSGPLDEDHGILPCACRCLLVELHLLSSASEDGDVHF
eukprot:s4043_g4.t1